MKKKLAFLCASFLLSSAFANPATTGTTVYVPPLTNAAPNQTYWIFTNHAYAIQNDTAIPQSVAVCMTTTLCYNAAGQYHKIIQNCDRFTLQPGESKNRMNNTQLEFNYPFTGYCDVTATTEAFGWQHSLATSKGKLHVHPN